MPGIKPLTDIEFINSKRTERFKDYHVGNNIVRHYFEVTCDGEMRKYDPIQYLELIREVYYKAYDNAGNYHERMTIIINAKATIKRLILEHNIDKSGYDCQPVLDDIEIVKEMVDGHIKYGTPINTRKENSKTAPIQLIDFFESASKYKYIIDLLAEQGYCQPYTHIWKDDNKGNKGILAAILKHLHTQHYYKNNKRPTNEQIKEIAQNTFGWEISIDTVKRSDPDRFDLSFIPVAGV